MFSRSCFCFFRSSQTPRFTPPGVPLFGGSSTCYQNYPILQLRETSRTFFDFTDTASAPPKTLSSRPACRVVCDTQWRDRGTISQPHPTPSFRAKRPDFFFRAAFWRVRPRREESLLGCPGLSRVVVARLGLGSLASSRFPFL